MSRMLGRGDLRHRILANATRGGRHSRRGGHGIDGGHGGLAVAFV